MTIDQRGFSLIEHLLVIVIVGSIILILSNLPNAIGLINKSKHLSLAREVAIKQLEDKRSLRYRDLTVGSSSIDDFRLNLLPEGTGAVLIEDCNPSLCLNDERLKQVTIQVSWKDNNKQQEVRLNSLVSNDGLNQ